MRRASEQEHVWRIVQAGMRGIGSAREAEVRDALDWGARLVTARDIHHPVWAACCSTFRKTATA